MLSEPAIPLPPSTRSRVAEKSTNKFIHIASDFVACDGRVARIHARATRERRRVLARVSSRVSLCSP